MSCVTPIGIREAFLVTRHPCANDLDNPRVVGPLIGPLSKYMVNAAILEYHGADYNNEMTGIVYAWERDAKQHVSKRQDEIYLRLRVPTDSISHVEANGHVFINPGYKPRVVSLHTADGRVYLYDEILGFQKAPAGTEMSASNRQTYDHRPNRWYTFAFERMHIPARTVLAQMHSQRGSGLSTTTRAEHKTHRPVRGRS